MLEIIGYIIYAIVVIIAGIGVYKSTINRNYLNNFNVIFWVIIVIIATLIIGGILWW